MDLITKIKNALKAAGLDEALSSKINVKEESEISGAVTALKKEMDSKKMTEDEWLKSIEGSDNKKHLDTYMQRETDRRVTAALKTHDENLDKKRIEDEQKLKDDEKNKNLSDDQKTIDGLTGQLKSLTDIVTNLQDGISKNENLTFIQSAIKEAGLPESLSAHITIEKPEDLKSIIEQFKAEFQVIKQSAIDETIKKGSAPPSSIGVGTVAEDKVTAYAEAKNKPEESTGFKAMDIPGGNGSK